MLGSSLGRMMLLITEKGGLAQKHNFMTGKTRHVEHYRVRGVCRVCGCRFEGVWVSRVVYGWFLRGVQGFTV